MEPARRAVPAGALALLAAALGLTGIGAWYVTSARTGAPVAEPASEAQPLPPGTAPVTGGTTATDAAPKISPVVAGSTAAPGDDLAALQQRLEAFARAYNEADSAALERVLWKNHAVVRPTGETMYRSDLLGQWSREWSELRNRELSFVVEQLTRDGSVLTAVWDLTLTADIVDEKGEVHKMEITGSQRATYTVTGEDWVLDEPIVYVGFERTIDGDPWPLGQNGR